MGLGSQVGPKLGRKIEPRQAKTGQDKGRQGKRREGKGKEEEGKGLEGKDVEKCTGGHLSRGGGGVHPTFRGRPIRDLVCFAFFLECSILRVPRPSRGRGPRQRTLCLRATSKCLRAASWSNDVLSEMDTGYKLRRRLQVNSVRFNSTQSKSIYLISCHLNSIQFNSIHYCLGSRAGVVFVY